MRLSKLCYKDLYGVAIKIKILNLCDISCEFSLQQTKDTQDIRFTFYNNFFSDAYTFLISVSQAAMKMSYNELLIFISVTGIVYDQHTYASNQILIIEIISTYEWRDLL